MTPSPSPIVDQGGAALDLGTLLGWVSSTAIAAVIATVITALITSYWERKKLARAERVAAYTGYLSADSDRWRAFATRDGLAKTLGRTAPEIAALDDDIRRLRAEMWRAYSQTQLVGSKGVVAAMFQCLKLSDQRQRSWGGRGASPPNPERARAIGALIAAARSDLSLKPLDRSIFSVED